MTDQPLVEHPEQVLAEHFRRMAARIEHNAQETFGGAVVIVPPVGGGDAIEFLVLGSKPDLAQFYSTVQTKITLALSEIQEKQQNLASAFGRR